MSTVATPRRPTKAWLNQKSQSVLAGPRQERSPAGGHPGASGPHPYVLRLTAEIAISGGPICASNPCLSPEHRGCVLDRGDFCRRLLEGASSGWCSLFVETAAGKPAHEGTRPGPRRQERRDQRQRARVSSARAKRAASDDAWERSGVSDVSNQLLVAGSRGSRSGTPEYILPLLLLILMPPREGCRAVTARALGKGHAWARPVRTKPPYGPAPWTWLACG
jgi:hypothetical protein